MPWAPVIGGGLLLALLGLEMGATIFFPRGLGGLTGWIVRRVWHVFQRLSRVHIRLLELAGPAALGCVITTWVLGFAVGFALIYWPFLPEQFVLAAPLAPAKHGDFTDALYLSLVTLAQVGYGDIVPRTGWLRVVAPLEGLAGLVVLTAALSWVLSLYPVLSRKGVLAERVSLARHAIRSMGLEPGEAPAEWLETQLAAYTKDIVQLRTDLVQFPIVYFFHAHERRWPMAQVLLELLALSETAASHPSPAVRLQAAFLQRALSVLAETLANDFLAHQRAAPREIFAGHARDHQLEATPTATQRAESER